MWMALLIAPALAADADEKIINGQDATANDFPMAGGLILDVEVTMQGNTQTLRLFTCSSTLIAPDVVSTAAHCVDEEALNTSFTFGFGTTTVLDVHWSRQADLSAYDGQGMADLPDDAVPAWDWVAHADFDMNALDVGVSKNSDVALVFLDEVVTDVDFAYLLQPDEDDLLVVDAPVIVVGWGQQVATNWWEQAPAGTYMIKQWGESHVAELGEHEFQVGKIETDVRKCHGDSGGPSFLMVDGDVRLVGITSHAYDQSDCMETGGVDTRVDAFRGWLDDEMSSRCDDRVWCDEAGIPDASLVPDDNVEAEILPEEKNRFGCSAVPAPASMVLILAAGLLARRRRRED